MIFWQISRWHFNPINSWEKEEIWNFGFFGFWVFWVFFFRFLNILFQSQLWPIIVPVWTNFRDGNGEKPEGKKVQLQAQNGILLKGRHQGYYWGYGALTKRGPSMTILQKIQQADERVRCRCLHPTNRICWPLWLN
jgi:hypothetical protein